jgi:tripartite-type tricarboxylate transporter receptor subunit TctC
MKKLSPIAIAISLIFASVSIAAAQTAADYPTRTIRIQVPFPPGSVSDVMARLAGQSLTARLGQSVVIENREGASGTIGTAYAAKAAPDGYTLLLGTVTTHGTNSGVYQNLSYDPIKDFDPITVIAATPNVLVVNGAGPIRTLADLAKVAKEKPGQFNYGSAGLGGGPYLCIELLKTMAGIDLLHVPYKGSPETLTAILRDEILITATSLTTALPMIKSGQMRALAVTSLERSPLLPDVPTASETYAGYEFTSWSGLFAPAGTPASVINKLRNELVVGLKDPAVQGKIVDLGGYVVANSPEEFKIFVANEVKKWPDLLRKLGVKAQ